MTTRERSLPSVINNDDRKLIVVTGANGSFGRSVIKALLQDEKYKIRALTRNLESFKSKQLARNEAVELVKCDFNDIEKLRTAFSGAYGVFAATAYWGCLKLCDAKDEIKQGYNMIDAAVANNVSHLIWVSQPNANMLSYNKLQTFTSNKNKVEIYARNKYSLSKTVFTYVYPGFALENIMDHFRFRIRDNMVQNDPLPINPDTKLAYVELSEDFGKIVKYLFDHKKQFKSEDFIASSGNITIPELLQLVAQEASLPWKFNQISYEEYEKLVKNRELVDLFRFWNEYGHLYQDVGVARKFIPELKTASQWVKSTGIDWLQKYN